MSLAVRLHPILIPRQHSSPSPTVYQGLIPWAWIEASTKGAVLLFVASEAEYYAKSYGANNFTAGITGGMVGGLAQAYATMGFCTCMKTVEITKHKVAATGIKPPGTIETFMDIWRREGLRGINKGVNAVAVRQVTNWGSRFGLSRVAENGIRSFRGKDASEKLSAGEKILASGLGGGLSAWNQPIEVIRVELQSKAVDPNRPKNMNVMSAARYIYSQNGAKGLYRGVTPRIGLGVVCFIPFNPLFRTTSSLRESPFSLVANYLHGCARRHVSTSDPLFRPLQANLCRINETDDEYPNSAKEAVEKLTGDQVTAKH